MLLRKVPTKVTTHSQNEAAGVCDTQTMAARRVIRRTSNNGLGLAVLCRCDLEGVVIVAMAAKEPDVTPGR